MRAYIDCLFLVFLVGGSIPPQTDDRGQTDHTAAGDERPSELKKSPHKILFECYDKDNWELFVMNADGSGRRNLTKTRDVHEMYPQASADGKRICFLQDVQRHGETILSVW